MKTALVCEILIPASTGMQSRRVRIDQLSSPHAITSIVKTHAGPVQAWYRASISSTDVALILEASRNVDLFLQRHLIYQRFRALVGVLPCTVTFALSFTGVLAKIHTRYYQTFCIETYESDIQTAK